MNTQQLNEQHLRHYLLGALPAEESEALDEQSFLDDDFAAQLQSAEDNLIDDYVYGALAAEEIAPFNTHYLATPRRRDKVKFAQALQTFTARAYPTLAAPTTVTAEPTAPATPSAVQAAQPWWRSLRDWFAAPGFALQTGLAMAAMLLFVGGGWLVFETLRLRGQLNQREAERAALQQRERELSAQLAQQRTASEQNAADLQSVRDRLAELERQRAQERLLAQTRPPALPPELNVAHFELTPQLRGFGAAATLTIPAGTAYVSLQLELETDEYAGYRVELRTQTDDRKVWSSGKLRSRARGAGKVLNVSLRADLLQPRGYFVKLLGVTATGAVEDMRNYPVKVVKK